MRGHNTVSVMRGHSREAYLSQVYLIIDASSRGVQGPRISQFSKKGEGPLNKPFTNIPRNPHI